MWSRVFSVDFIGFGKRLSLPKTNMTMENQPFEDVLFIETGWFSIVMLVFGGVLLFFGQPPTLVRSG